MYDRLVGYLRDLNYSAQEVDAVVSLRPPRWAELPKRLAAVRAFAALPESASLAAANKRIGNILKKSDAAPAASVDAIIARRAGREGAGRRAAHASARSPTSSSTTASTPPRCANSRC